MGMVGMAGNVAYLDVCRKEAMDREMSDVRDFKKEIELVITKSIEQGRASTGIYDAGVAIVAVDVVDEEITFRWYHTTYDFFSLVDRN
jgi:hypothetical protein